MNLKDKRIGFIGGGAMAEAIIRGVVNAGLIEAGKITVSAPTRARLQYLEETFAVSTAVDNKKVAATSDVLFLAVKPQVIGDVFSDISASVGKSTVVVSIVAGVRIETIERQLPCIPVIRVMPNTPVAVGEGMSAMALGSCASAADGDIVAAVFAAIGKTIVVKEYELDAVTGVSGCGPGYAFVLIDALADAGVLVGFPRQKAIMLAAQTLLGAAKMVLETGEHPAELRDKVTSPGGITIQGIHVLEQRAVRAALIDAVVKTTELSREMGKRNE